MEEKILKLGKAIEKFIIIQMSSKNLLDKKPSVSFILESIISYRPFLSIIEDLRGEELIRPIFVAYNLLNGDREEEALMKSSNINWLVVRELQGEEYHNEVDCPECDGTGEVECNTCYGGGTEDCEQCEGSGEDEGEECYRCDGSGEMECRDCDGRGLEECSTCAGHGVVDNDEEVVDVVVSTIVTQNTYLYDEIMENYNENTDEIKNFGEIIGNYLNEIIRFDIFNDTVSFKSDWGGDSEVLTKLLSTYIPIKNFRINKVNNNLTRF